ncbi:MAG: TIR domain-containing protein [wastewater metagenome]|nr:TIR domain-containing protein [Candidatus Loosdrechtia aerotolerans]
MTTEYKPPLAIHFIWNPADKKSVEKILDSVRSSFARDVDRPFSRGLNIPLFFYSSENPSQPPLHSPEQQAAKDIVFVFASVNTLGREAWKSYIDQLSLSNTSRAVPIAIDKDGLGHGDGNLKNLNFLRSYEWLGDLREQRAVLAMAHEIFRHGFVEIGAEDHGKRSSIKIFLSHAKAGETGRLHAESIYKFIDNTNMSRFFDATEISPGFKFDEEIIKHIKESTLVAIGSDAYSSRYWCQREILCAKQHQRPIIAVDCLQDFEDRVFPAGSNVPCVHVSPDTPISEPDILRVLIATILETIRHHHAKKSLEYYKSQNWIDNDCTIISRPPEIRQVIELENSGKQKVCYPEPSLYSEEADWLSHFEVDAFTPLWSRAEDGVLDNWRIGISISDNPTGNYSTHHLHPDHLKRLSQDLARHLLARAGTIIYGGDLRKDGFTQFILDEAIALKTRLNTENIHVENHLAWPLYISDPEIVAWRAKYSGVIKSIEHNIPSDIKKDIDKDAFIAPSGTENKYVWSRCLTQMREKSIDTSHARICTGGKLAGYHGKMPGVLEEIIISIKKNKPIFLLGAFGGVVGEVCKTITDKSLAEPITEHWQITNNGGYFELQKKAKQDNQNADYTEIKSILESMSIEDLARSSGLNSDDYQRLMASPFVDECVHLVLKGLKTLASTSKCKEMEEHDE